jgi:hypothetical protein
MGAADEVNCAMNNKVPMPRVVSLDFIRIDAA